MLSLDSILITKHNKIQAHVGQKLEEIISFHPAYYYYSLLVKKQKDSKTSEVPVIIQCFLKLDPLINCSYTTSTTNPLALSPFVTLFICAASLTKTHISIIQVKIL